MIWTYMIIFILAAIPFFEIALIIPIAIIGGMPSIPVMIVSFLGNLFTVFLLIVFVDKVREWRNKRKKSKSSEAKRHKRAHILWDKYGLPGLAFIGPFLVGSHLAALLALTFGGAKGKTLWLMTVSLFGWTVIFGVASYYGFDLFIADDDNAGFIRQFIQ